VTTPTFDVPSADAGDDPRKRHLSDLQRYAGWLSKDHVSVVVRAESQALGVSMDQGSDPSSSLEALDKDIRRLPSGGLRKMLRRTVAELRAVLEIAELEENKGDRP
jgi:hypothetical protein